jgi:hypothetical protein
MEVKQEVDLIKSVTLLAKIVTSQQSEIALLKQRLNRLEKGS